MDLMAAYRAQVYLKLPGIDPVFAEALYGVHMKQDVLIVCFHDTRRFLDWLYGADFVVHVHDGHQDRILAQRLLKRLQLDPSVTVHREIGHTEPLFLQVAHGIDDGRMLDG